MALTGADLEENSGGRHIRQLSPFRLPANPCFFQDQAYINTGYITGKISGAVNPMSFADAQTSYKVGRNDV